MRVFVTGTGRCGSVSFREACRYATNFRTGHETKNGILEYPDQWIEVNPQLRHCIPHLAEKYPAARWVHLIRAAEPCIRSLAALDGGRVMRAYETLHDSILPSRDVADIAWRFYWAENDSIRAQLAHKVPFGNALELELERIQDDWAEFWSWIGAEGDFESSLRAWDIRRNTTEERLTC